jgi:hypothetical protein
VNGSPVDRDPLEDRLREALRRPDPLDRTDGAGLLDAVHAGARRRRARRLVASVAAVAVVAGGGFVAVSGALDSRGTPVADRSPTAATTGTASSSSQSGGMTPGRSAVPLSLTATGTAYQWVLVGRDDGSGSSSSCASVYSTADAGATWSKPRELGVPAGSTGWYGATPVSPVVSQLRFSRPAGGGPANGWAFGGTLLSSHDSGASWHAPKLPVAGAVRLLEAWRTEVYAAVDTGSGVVVVRSPADRDSWTVVDTGFSLTSVSAIAAAPGELAVIATTGDGAGPHVLVTVDGSSWSVRSPCPPGYSAEQLSTAAGPAPGADSLWLACASGERSVARVTLDAGAHWEAVQAPKARFTLAARSVRSALAVTNGRVERLSPGSAPATIATVPVNAVAFAGFTNPATGYIVGSDGRMWRSADGGNTWQVYSVRR